MFPALDQQVYGKELVYFDNAATAQKPQSVLDLINTMNSKTNANIHRAVHKLSAEATEMAIDVLPTPGGPTRQMICPFMSGARARTAMNSRIRSFTRSIP
mgnify:CR=1 FL=1